jgi:hypothetical protein
MKSNKKNQTKKIKTCKKGCGEWTRALFSRKRTQYKEPSPNNLLQIYNNAKNIKNRRTI